jgi:Protein of unknown function (DUF2490)
MTLIKKIFLVSICVFMYSPIFSQTNRQYAHNNNSWWMYIGSHKISEKWGLHLEAQLRRSDFVKQKQQLLLRTGINYHFNAQASATFGYCFVSTGQYGGFPAKSEFPEHRLWEQIQLKSMYGKVEMVNRFRLEQRFSNLPIANNGIFEPGDAVYTNRFRLLSRFSIPLKGKSIEDKSWYVSFYDEFFVNFGKNVGLNIFDQNRAYLALGYKIPQLGRLELGYLNQLIFRSDGIRVENNRTLFLGLSSNIDFYKKK